jgi:hypothetical protein
MTRRARSRRRIDPFAHPDPEAFAYEPLLEALRLCRQEVERFRIACGPRNPAYREAEALSAQIDAVARLTRVPDAASRVGGSGDFLGH